ncbi:MAG: UDP-N-acetylglucosamine 2-epimerase (hydrolyzing) [Phycisphaerales bacterium]|nr:MAG: UDP-N-acetylglucosamine 2-epimerase (hydrolyzing) [Phycisphaerales bacterium]
MTATRSIAIVTGTRAEFGLLRPVIRAVEAHPDLNMQLIVTGTHNLPPAYTSTEVEAEFKIAAKFQMQRPGEVGRISDVTALGGGIQEFGGPLQSLSPDVVLVLGDRIEAFGAAAAAAVAGIRVAHMHGGDRAEGIADEALRHAITKLAHLHLPATQQSAQRIIAMGEDPQRVHVVGSPAIDGLDEIARMADAEYAALGKPEIVYLLHPTGRSPEREREDAGRLLDCCIRFGRTVALHPNHDPGREGILQAIDEASCPQAAHFPREKFVALLRRARVVVGNSSAGLIECAALGLPCVNVGSRQAGRERAGNVIDVPEWDRPRIEAAICEGIQRPITAIEHPYGDGRTGPRTADVLAGFDAASVPLTKRNTY